MKTVETEYVVRINVHTGRRGRPRFIYEAWDPCDGYSLVDSIDDAFRYAEKPDPALAYYRALGRIEIVTVQRRTVEEIVG